jgi:hypothetical protein
MFGEGCRDDSRTTGNFATSSSSSSSTTTTFYANNINNNNDDDMLNTPTRGGGNNANNVSNSAGIRSNQEEIDKVRHVFLFSSQINVVFFVFSSFFVSS